MAWLAVDWAMKVGALLLFLGVGWLVRFVFWEAIGEIGRTLIGIAIGLLALGFGHLRLSRSTNQGAVIEGLGAGILSYTMFVARSEYDFFTPLIALAFLFLVTVFVGFSSVVSRTQALALIGLTFGSAAPLLVHSPSANFLGLFGYLFILSVGTLWVVRLTGWRALTFASFLPYLIYSLPFVTQWSTVKAEEAWLMAGLFAGLYFFANIWAMLKTAVPDKADLATALANCFLLAGWIYATVDPVWQGLVTAGAALAFSGAAIIAYRWRGVGTAVYVYAAAAGLLLGLATAFEFSGSVLVIAFTLEVAFLFTGTLAFFGGAQAAKPLAFLFGLPLVLALPLLERYAFADAVLTEEFAALLVLTLSLLACGTLMHRFESAAARGWTGRALSLSGALLGLTLFWIALHNTDLSPDQATTLALVVFTLFGLALSIIGNLRGETFRKQSGLALLIFVIGHLLIIDVWTMDTLARIVTFCVIGLLLMSTAFIGKKRLSTPNTP